MADNITQFSKLDAKTQDLLLEIGSRFHVAKNIEKILREQLEEIDSGSSGDKVVVRLNRFTFYPPVDKLGVPLNKEVNITIKLFPTDNSIPKYKYTYKYLLKNKVPITIDYPQVGNIILSSTILNVYTPNDDPDTYKLINIISSPKTLDSGHLAINFIANNNLGAWKASLYEIV